MLLEIKISGNWTYEFGYGIESSIIIPTTLFLGAVPTNFMVLDFSQLYANYKPKSEKKYNPIELVLTFHAKFICSMFWASYEFFCQ